MLHLRLKMRALPSIMSAVPDSIFPPPLFEICIYPPSPQSSTSCVRATSCKCRYCYWICLLRLRGTGKALRFLGNCWRRGCDAAFFCGHCLWGSRLLLLPKHMYTRPAHSKCRYILLHAASHQRGQDLIATMQSNRLSINLLCNRLG